MQNECQKLKSKIYYYFFKIRHFESTQHTYTMDLKRQHVWDYVGDNYVHRLIQNKSDGKLVELRGEGVTSYDIVRINIVHLRSFLIIHYRTILMKVHQRLIQLKRKLIRLNLK